MRRPRAASGKGRPCVSLTVVSLAPGRRNVFPAEVRNLRTLLSEYPGNIRQWKEKAFVQFMD